MTKKQFPSSNLRKDFISRSQTHSDFFHLTESFNASKLHYIIEHFEEFPTLHADESHTRSRDPLLLAKRYLEKSRNGTIYVEYAKSSHLTDDHGVIIGDNSKEDGNDSNNEHPIMPENDDTSETYTGGRWFAIGALSLQSLKKEIRHTIASEHYVDLDIRNCHPVLLQHLCKVENLACPYLDSYVKHRDQILNDTNLELVDAKTLYLSLTNGGKNDYKNLKVPSKHAKGYKKEMSLLHQHFANKNPHLLEKVKQKRRAEKKDYNHEAALMNVLLCQLENDILMTMYSFFGSPQNAVLCFDGIMLPKYQQDQEMQYDLVGCTDFVTQKLGIKIELCIKPMDKRLPLPEEIPLYTYPSLEYYCDFKKMIGENKTTHLEWVEEWSQNTIKLIENGGKQFFLTKNRKTESFGQTLQENTYIDEWTPIKISDLESSLKVQCRVKNPYYNPAIEKTVNDISQSSNFKARKSLTPYQKTRAEKFRFKTLGITNSTIGSGYLSHIMENRLIDSYNHVVFYPFCANKGPPAMDDCFNVFTGFPADRIHNHNPKVDLPSFTESRFFNHLKSEFFNDNLGELNHFLDHLADIIQDPAHIKGTSHLFYSQQGTGKGLLAALMCKLLGNSNIAIIINTDAYFDKNFNADRVNKLLKIFEEVSEKGSAFKNHNRLKGEQTSVRERIENKGIDPYHTLHCARFWYFTNNENSLYIENDDRRHTLHRINNRMANNFEYFEPIWQEINNPLFIKAAFQFLSTRIYTTKSVLNSFDTQYKREQKVANIPNGIKFLIEYVETKYCANSTTEIQIASSGLREEWRLWCTNYGCKYNLGTLQTQLKTLGIEAPKQVRVNGATPKKCYSFNLATLQESLQRYFRDSSWKFDFADETENTLQMASNDGHESTDSSRVEEIDNGYISETFIL